MNKKIEIILYAGATMHVMTWAQKRDQLLRRLAGVDSGVAHRRENLAERWAAQQSEAEIIELRPRPSARETEAPVMHITENPNPDTESDAVLMVEVPDTDSRYLEEMAPQATADVAEAANDASATDEALPKPVAKKSIASYLD